jgi:hypothetical protein|nr:MAG TPA: hypothetical protein [Caudoviricetes sp.]
MYNVSEYILAKRSAYITEKALEKSLTYRSFNEGENKPILYERFKPDNFYKVQKNFEFLIETIFPGSIVKKFVSINTNISLKAIPLFIVEIFDPYFIRIPFIITQDSVLAISAFGNSNTEEIYKNKWFGEIIPTHVLAEITQPEIVDLVQRPVYVNETMTMTIEEIIKLIVESYAIGTTDADQVLSNNFDSISALDIMELSVESSVFKHIDKTFGTESILQLDKASAEDIISPTDFLPIQVEHGDTNAFVYVTSNDKGRLKVSTSSEEAEQTTVKVPKSAVNTILVELDSLTYFIFDDKILIEQKDGQPIEWSLFDITALNEEVNDALNTVGTEGFIGTMRDVYQAIKIFGLRKGSLMYQVFMNITKLPRKLAAWVWSALKRAMKTRNQREKEDMLEFQEKLLNDEFDIILERIKMMSENSVRSWVWTIILGPIYFLPFMYILQRNANRTNKLRAIERLEFKIDGLLERHEQKLEYAKQEGNPEEVDKLLAEKHNMEFARMKLIEFKRDLVQKDRIRYMTFNKDLSMNGRQRIDALMQSGSYFNVGMSNGQGYTVETRLGGLD